jgi:ubiquinone/menaquinone biosynthesis C-methylase UbiE
MGYNEEFWNKYSDENESRYNEEFSKFVRDLATSLRCTSVLEVGCGTGIDLRLFSDAFQIHGIDLNEHALKIAQEKLSIAKFKKGSITELPFEDSSIDFVFTHGLMNYLDDETLEKGVAEMFRVSKRWIKKWLDYKVKFVSNVDMHEDIEPDKPRFTLLKKL